MDNVSSDELLSMAWQRWGILPKQTTRGEWHSGCPFCGEGRDRFVVFDDGGFWCRVCGVKGWLDDDKKTWHPDPAKLAAAKARELELETMRQVDIAKRISQLQTDVEREAYQLGRDDERRWIAEQYFKSEGISQHAIDFYGLGYIPDHPVKVSDAITMRLPAYTIPIRDPKTWNVINQQYRLVDPPAGIGKYRQEYNLPAASFYADDRVTGDAVVVEGAKKSIVVYEFGDAKVQVIGLPGCSPAQRLVDDLKCFDRVWVWLDPGAERQAARIAKQMKRARVITCAWKPDDAITKGKLTRDELHSFFDVARFN